MAAQRGFTGMLHFFAGAFHYRIGWLVFLVAFFLLPVFGVIAASLHAWVTAVPLSFNMTASEFPLAYVWLLLLGGPVAEEFGWSYLSDRLDTHFTLRVSTLLLGLIWGFWHLPLFAIVAPGLTQHFVPFWLFLIGTVAARFLFSWAYHRSGRRILSNLLFHNAFNLSLSIVTIIPPVAGDLHDRLAVITILIAIAAFAVWRLLPVTPGSPRTAV